MKQPNFLDKYFDVGTDYPTNCTEAILPLNTLYNYISSTFLNGFINYVTIKKAYVCGRYTKWEELIDPVKLYDKGNWTTFEGTKEKIYNLAIKPERVFHTKLDMFHDDIVILAKSKPEEKYFWYFWFDMDVSDCSIGRFKTDISEDEVIEDFSNFIKTNSSANELGEVKELPLNIFQGWISF